MPVNSKAQDLPPEGGYKPIYYKRVPTVKWMRGWQWIAAYLATSAFGFAMYANQERIIRRENAELRSSKFVIQALVQAERDREFLKQLRRNRDEEAALMANVEGWQVGTWYGEPVFKTFPKDRLVNPSVEEYYAHADPKHLADLTEFRSKT